MSSVVQLVCQFLLWSVSRVPVIFEHARLVFVSFKRDLSARLCFGRFDECRKDLFHFMPASALFVLISRMIRFLMQELLALAGLSCWSSLERDC